MSGSNQQVLFHVHHLGTSYGVGKAGTVLVGVLTEAGQQALHAQAATMPLNLALYGAPCQEAPKWTVPGEVVLRYVEAERMYRWATERKAWSNEFRQPAQVRNGAAVSLREARAAVMQELYPNRDPRDVKSDWAGDLIHDPAQPLRPAAVVTQEQTPLDDKAHPRFIKGYEAGLADGKRDKPAGEITMKLGIDTQAVQAFTEKLTAIIKHDREVTDEQVADLLSELTLARVAPDKHVEANRTLLLNRSEAGLRKYGVTLERNDLELGDWLQHLLEELLDAANYVQTAKAQLEANAGLRQMSACGCGCGKVEP